eukprot:CAMPEP_0182419514 /NCGR_PEP_ID=MMETSP1167-20130531/3944_1 /TAXON_ID=2988 /ORGANISM="Mallomonas Sp, Strain CCMP3275" /LENGTH=211 /DNA_ID=CAMNT_0024594483 /DNA_START=396 /DNA_END=1028 /DNA_ORIENTATION=-
MILKRLDKLEKAVSQNPKNSKTAFEKMMHSFSVDTFTLNPQNIQTCSVIGCFFLGTAAGYALLDRLWLLFGLLGGFIAYGAVNTDSILGESARGIGVQVAYILQAFQEKYNQFYMFYRTGQFAYIYSKTVEQYDKYFGITDKWKNWKRAVSDRAGELSDWFQRYDLEGEMAQLGREVLEMNDRYGITSSLTSLTQSIVSYTSESIEDLFSW